MAFQFCTSLGGSLEYKAIKTLPKYIHPKTAAVSVGQALLTG